MTNISFKKIIPHLVAIVFFLILSFTYFSPLLEGKKIRQSDMTNYYGMSKELRDYKKETGENVLWSNSMFGGMPTYLTSNPTTKSFIKHIHYFFSFNNGARPANFIFMYFLSFYIALLLFGVNPWLSIVGALAYGFSSYFFVIIDAGHTTKIIAIGYMPVIIAGVYYAFKKNMLLGSIIFSIFFAMQLLVNHLQITYYSGLIILILGIFQFVYSYKNKILKKFFKTLGVLIIAAILAIGSNINNIWLTYEYSKYSIRGKSELTANKDNKTSGLDKDYATSWSYGIDETLTLLIPNFKGGASGGALGTNSETYKILKQNNVPNARNIIKQQPCYWGTQPFTSGPVYIGAIVFFLFILSLFILRGKTKWWLLSATILSILLAWGKNFMPLSSLFLDYFPGYNKFRTVSMILVIAEFTMPLLAFLGLKKIFDGKVDKKSFMKAFKYSLYIVGGITLFFTLFPGAFFDFKASSDAQYVASGYPEWLVNAWHADRKSLLQTDAFRSLIFILLSATVLLTTYLKKINKNTAYVLFAVLIIIDMWPINKRYVNNNNFVTKKEANTPYHPQQYDMQILQSELNENPEIQKQINDKITEFKKENKNKISIDEINNIKFTTLNFATDYRIFNLAVNTFNDASTAYFHKSIGGYHAAKMKRYQELIDYQISKNNMDVLNMLNTKYFIIPAKGNNQATVQQNPNTLGNAWFVEKYKIVENADSEINELSNFSPANELIVDKRFKKQIDNFSYKKDSTANINLNKYTPTYLKYTSNSKVEQLAVFSEIYYDKGWDAFIDGKLSPYFRANYVLRAMKVPAGKHTIEFKFEPKSYVIGNNISIASSSILILLLIGIFAKEFLKKKEQ
ncbi:MAG: YfhO family protein [Bacteroidetes bacterium]|nr:YfhO family protein [Bacteroidota bacterium]